VVNRAKSFIKSCYEKQLYGFAWAGASFALRNIGKEDWQDEVTQNQNQQITKVEIIEKKRDAE
jgi:thermostable 8-oxoguanine DNA glycosylase